LKEFQLGTRILKVSENFVRNGGLESWVSFHSKSVI